MILIGKEQRVHRTILHLALSQVERCAFMLAPSRTQPSEHYSCSGCLELNPQVTLICLGLVFLQHPILPSMTVSLLTIVTSAHSTQY
jgi:hypothetical protein